MRRLGVVGWPVAHSRSPAMHNAALEALVVNDGVSEGSAAPHSAQNRPPTRGA